MSFYRTCLPSQQDAGNDREGEEAYSRTRRISHEVRKGCINRPSSGSCHRNSSLSSSARKGTKTGSHGQNGNRNADSSRFQSLSPQIIRQKLSPESRTWTTIRMCQTQWEQKEKQQNKAQREETERKQVPTLTAKLRQHVCSFTPSLPLHAVLCNRSKQCTSATGNRLLRRGTRLTWDTKRSAPRIPVIRDEREMKTPCLAHTLLEEKVVS